MKMQDKNITTLPVIFFYQLLIYIYKLPQFFGG